VAPRVLLIVGFVATDWEDVRNEWETLHAIRAMAVATGFAMIYFAVPLPQRGAKA
jgi:hypothetical protein